MTACPPNNPPPDESAIAALIQADPCSALPELRVAYYKAIAGTKRSHVSFKDRSTQYQAASPAFLQREIQKLERMCPGPHNPTPHARAAVARGHSRGLGILPAGYFSRYR